VAVPGVFGSRILLNMRKEYFKRDETLDSDVLSSVNPVWQGGMELQSVKRTGAAQGVSSVTSSVNIYSKDSQLGYQRAV